MRGRCTLSFSCVAHVACKGRNVRGKMCFTLFSNEVAGGYFTSVVCVF